MKKKTCEWLDSNIWGGIQILDDNILPCCITSTPCIHEKDLDYSKISVEEIIEKRKRLQEEINEGTACQGCEHIVEKEESDIDVGKVQYLSIGLFSTCNLRCRYCYFTHEELSDKLTPERTHLLPFVKKLSEHNMLKDNVSMGIAGGEPTLFEDLPETIKFLENTYKKPSVTLLSNSSISGRVDKIVEGLKDAKLYKVLYTSVDCGTRETYKFLRGKDLFNDLSGNLLKYAKNKTFNLITLKYILMFDHCNTDDKNIFGFLRLFGKVMNAQSGEMAITIDCDMNAKEDFDEKMIAAGGKLYYVVTEIFGAGIRYIGGDLVQATKRGRERIKQIEDYASNYKKSHKSFYENIMLAYLQFSACINNIKKSFKTLRRILTILRILHFQ